MSARVYFMKTANGCKDVSFMSLQDEQCLYTVFSCFTNYILMHGQNINKQIVNISDENLMDYSFLKRYHYTKSKNYLRRRY